ncbi:calcineurin-like phosphoesterase C-terminal domain-containing protein [Geodermatophilus sp. DSM 44513]|uniref:calcineurin-like phosphoesterase C-terminal domain-containing protein n=1 Tax=Geodermatophilus sp. DSM 44513 TaxID=1528104 RepID=UPI001AA0C670|nr:calcineurin-like phosphoesterase C-terminal domain-containing protein [Geodermatophilus sp. DSM 44513]WNV76210.1 calcineurin-like phosphoesterase family protein [Geodermatophilus sp. DSM 44513]
MGATLLVGSMNGATAEEGPDAEATGSYVGQVEVVRDAAGGAGSDADTIEGTVFEDADRDSRQDRREDGVAGVSVSNGREVVVTDEDGAYALPVYDGMTVFVTKPAGWEVPLDEQNFPQFSYHHLPEGSPPLRFDGLPPTGPLPQAINFPMVQTGGSTGEEPVDCAVIGDTQTYSNQELGFLRDGVVNDLERRDDLAECGAFIVGDVAGDDLGLYPRIKEVMSLADVPVRAVPGNHDIDFDATDDAHSFDTYKREIGPAYYSYDVGNAHFVGLDNVRYPCTSEDNTDGDHEFCTDPANHPTYTGVIGEEQLTWLANDLEHVSKDKLVVIGTHIPLVSFLDQDFVKHQTDDVQRLYELLEGREAVSVSGHTQVVENLTPGDSYAGWQEYLGVDTVPFRHLTVGAASGSWYTGNLSTAGSDSGIIPETLQREGGPAGYVNLELGTETAGDSYRVTYRATGRSEEEQMTLSVNSPFFREWYDTLATWSEAQEELEEPDPRAVPPVNLNDLGDPNLLTRQDLAGGSHLTANVWNGETATEVTVQVDDRAPVAATRTQQADGEGILEGAEFGDPYALMWQMQVTRNSLESTSGNERAQGWEAFRGDDFGPGPTQPLDSGLWADQSSHLWQLPLPAGLGTGGHTATVRVVDPAGREFVETLNFEVVDERPQPFFRTELFPAED